MTDVVQGQQATELQEIMLPQSKVNAIIAAEKDRAYQKGLEAAKMQVQPAPVNEPQVPSPAINMDEIAVKAAQIAQEKLNKDMQERQAKELEDARKKQIEELEKATIASLQKKMDGIHERMPDWKETVEKGGLSGNDALWALADQVDNPGETMYELSKSPDKAIMVLSALQTGQLGAAQQYLVKLSESLKANDAAKNAPKISKPLDKITPSNTNGSGGSSSARSVTDWKAYFANKSSR